MVLELYSGTPSPPTPFLPARPGMLSSTKVGFGTSFLLCTHLGAHLHKRIGAALSPLVRGCACPFFFFMKN